jgi:sterol 14-demethylase
MVAHRDPEVFQNPLDFDPNRYGPGREEDKRPFGYIAFGGGRHKCMGNAFAILQIKTIIAVLLNRYDFELVGDPIETDFQGLVLGPKPPIRIRYRRRARAA